MIVPFKTNSSTGVVSSLRRFKDNESLFGSMTTHCADFVTLELHTPVDPTISGEQFYVNIQDLQLYLDAELISNVNPSGEKPSLCP